MHLMQILVFIKKIPWSISLFIVYNKQIYCRNVFPVKLLCNDCILKSAIYIILNWIGKFKTSYKSHLKSSHNT